MAFVPRTYEQIRDDMIDFMRLNTDMTDFVIGSVLRTVIEAAALEDDEQYFQMTQLLSAFQIATASGKDLDDRVAEYGIIRLQAESSAGEVVIQDNNLVRNQLAFSVLSAAGAITLDDSNDFPTAGFPHTIRIGEGTLGVEDLATTANAVGTGVLTLGSPLINDHDAGDRVSLVDGTVDVALFPGIRVQVPPLGDDAAIIFVTVESGTIVNGDFESTPIKARSEVPGSSGNVGVSLIKEFVTAPPFDGSRVTNKRNFAGGRELETDAELRDKAQAHIQSLTRGTVLALQQGVLGVSDEVTGQRVTTSNVRESFVFNEVTVFVDDGTGFTPDVVQLAATALALATAAGVGVFSVTSAANFPEEGFLLASPESDAQRELLEFSGVDHNLNTISLVGLTQNTHDLTDEIVLVDLVEDSAESGANFFQLANPPVVRATQRVWVAPNATGVGFVLQMETANYELNRGTGQLELTGSGLVAGSQVVATYTYYTGLIATVQKVIDGDPDDSTNFPGIRAAGSRVAAETSNLRRITVKISIVARTGFQEADLVAPVSNTIEAYINRLGIGDDVIIAEIVERSMGVRGMFDAVVTSPTSNVTVLENELPVPIDASGNSLVTVT